jgi:ubiquinone/menaquinone biosynthesis C-methylase UbiE
MAQRAGNFNARDFLTRVAENFSADSIRMKISYDSIADDYAAHRNIHPNLLQKIIESSGITTKSRVLEVGCGTGNYISAIASLISPRMFWN